MGRQQRFSHCPRTFAVRPRGSGEARPSHYTSGGTHCQRQLRALENAAQHCHGALGPLGPPEHRRRDAAVCGRRDDWAAPPPEEQRTA
mmetsp:Transcript_20711/g.44148  ORF Transcript_20711/g.44148 Transcript_20711/m.44148 type:complete len:88 (+) Transcript_20711:1146-1409(+)